MHIVKSLSWPRRTAIAIVFVFSVCLSGCASLVNHHYKPTVDAPQGVVALKGLAAPVTIRRDAHGIPLIEAASPGDLAMAMGYVNAADRLTQMVGMKLVAQGRVAEMAGPGLLDLDIYMRTINLSKNAQHIYAQIGPEQQALLERYCEGVNAYVAQHRNRMPPGLALAGHTPETWTPLDSISLFSLISLGLSFNFHEEVAALAVAQLVGLEKTAWLMPIYPDEPIPFAETAKLKELNLSGLGASTIRLTELFSLLRPLGLGGVMASNNWAISQEKSMGEASIFCNDMHLPLSMPAMYNMMQIRCGDMSLAGMNIAGLPSIIAGYNGHIAWGMTMVMADTQDLFLEQLKTIDGRMHYLYQGQWRPVIEREERFRIKGEKEPLSVRVKETIHGPLLNDILERSPVHMVQAPRLSLPRYGIALSQATAPVDHTIEAFFELSQAQNAKAAAQICRRIRSISLNLVFADKENIGWQVTGTIPLRGRGRGLFPSPGWSGVYDWRGLLEAEALPCAWNPAAGFIATANNRTTAKEYPHVLSSSWYWPDRVERIMQMLSENDRHTPESCKTMQLDVRSPLAFKLQAVLDHGQLSEEIAAEINGWQSLDQQNRARLVLSRLQGFDGEMQDYSSDAALLSAFLNRVTHNLFADEIDKEQSGTWEAFLVLNSESYNATSDHLLVRGDESPFWDDIHTSTRETKAMIIARSLSDTAEFLEKKLGGGVEQWQWGALHTYTWETDTAKMAPRMGLFKRIGLRLLWPYFNRGPYAAAGDPFTLNVSNYTIGGSFDTWIISSMRMIVDFSRKEPMIGVNSSGQSDNPSSPHYDDGIDAWREGKYIAFPFKEENVKSQYTQALVLQPATGIPVESRP